MDITPASAVQVMDSGELVEIGDDVLGIAKDLRDLAKQLDVDFRLRYSERQDVWIVYQVETHPLTGEVLKKQVVTTSQTLDPRLIMRVRKITDPSYDLAGELEKIEAQKKRDAKHALRESIGPRAERLAHALRKDTMRHQRRIFVPDSAGGLATP